MPHPALIVVDMQEHFRDGMAETIVENVNNLVGECLQNSIPITFTQHGHLDRDFEKPPKPANVLVKWWGASNSIRYGSKAWQLLPELHVPKRAHIITSKHTYDAFLGTELESILDEHGVDTVIIAGVMTNLCCETTARSAFTRNFNVVFLSDGTATVNTNMQQASLLNLEYGFAKVMTCEGAKHWIVQLDNAA